MTQETETKPEEQTQPMPTDIWLTPEVVQAIIEATEIFEDIENELQKG